MRKMGVVGQGSSGQLQMCEQTGTSGHKTAVAKLLGVGGVAGG